MLNTRLTVAQNVQKEINDAEALADALIAKLGDLSKAMVKARVDARLPISIARSAFERLGDTTKMAFDVRSQIVFTHDALAEAKSDMGLDVVGYGGLQSCPNMADTSQHDARSTPLKIVS